MVGHTFLYNPGIQAVKEYLDAGEVGGFTTSTRSGRASARSGPT